MNFPEKSFFTSLLLLILILPSSSSSKPEDDQNLFPSFLVNPNLFTYSRQSFSVPDLDLFNFSGDASLHDGSLQITPDTISDKNFTLFQKSGRAIFRRPFKFWETNNDRSLSFNTTFLINLYPTPTRVPGVSAYGEGLTFLIAPDLQTPPGSTGGFLGLTNSTNQSDPVHPSNKFVAIEFDTVKQDYDPNNNHVGLNINSIISNKTVNLSEYDVEISRLNATWYRYTVWIEYSGASKILDVYIVSEGRPKPIMPLLSQKINLKEYVNQYSYFGFSASTGDDRAQLNGIINWNLTVGMISSKENTINNKNKLWLWILLGVGIPGLVICLAGSGYYLAPKWSWNGGVKKEDGDGDDTEILKALNNLPGMPREFTFTELKEATNNFDEKMKLGQGGYGVVYKGVLANENTEIAVKKFLRESLKSKLDFLAELTIINRLRHKHLVRLAGWCHKNGMLLLVYDYMPNGSVDYHLYSGTNAILLWSQRYNIITHVASALNYLHNEYDQTVVHRDLKASNIMLDSDFNARLGDFGLARAIDHERSSYSELGGMPGTLGYIAPECFHTGKATKETDVFGFGAVVLEIVCGKRPWTKLEGWESLVDWVWMLYREGRILEAVDKRLENEYVVEEAEKLLLLGLACSHPIASERPKMQIIFQIVSGTVQVPSVPVFKPSFFLPSSEHNTDESIKSETPFISISTQDLYPPDLYSVRTVS